MKSITRKIFLIVCAIVLAAALAVGLALAFTGNGTTFAVAASGFDVGEDNYSSFGSAWSAAESGSSADNPQTIVLNENVTLSSTYTVKEGENVILDLNGYSINIKSKGKLVDVYGTFTLKDDTSTSGKYTGSNKVGVYTSSNGYMTVYEADDGTGTDTLCKYYYTSGAIYGASSSSNSVGVVMAYNGGVFNMDGGSIVSNKYTPSNINTSQSATVYADSESFFNMTGGSISGNTTTNSVTVYLKGSGKLCGGVISGNTDDNDGTVYAGTALEIGGTVISGNTAQCGGGVAAVCDVVMNSGEICCNTTTGSGLFGSGAGIYILSGNLYMNGGTIHDNNVTSSSYGGGAIFAYGSSSTRYVVKLSGGDIYNNYAYENGGGVLAYYVDVIMCDGMKIRKNESRFGAGVYTANASPYATFTMYGGEISDNKANQAGGASYCYGTTTIYGGLVSDNTAVTGGGAFYVRSQPFAIEGGTFTGNSTSGTSSNYGGGVFCTADSSSSVTVTGGVYTDNYSAGYGGAMCFYTGTASVSGVTVTDNSAGKYGGGMYKRSNATVSFSGDVYVRDNYVGDTRENVFLDNNATITLSGALGSGSYIGVYIYSANQTQVTTSENGTSYYLEALRYFHSDVLLDGKYLGYGDSFIGLNSDSYVARVDSPSSATSTFYTSVSSALDAARATSVSDAGTAVLLSSFTVPSYSGDAWYEVGSSYFITLDLNGYNMVLDSTNIRAFAVSGNFTLTDSWEAYRYLGTSGTLGATKYSSLGSYETVYRYTDTETGEVGYWSYTSGAITGANSYEDDEENNGVVKVSEGGTFNMLGGTLTGNRSYQGTGVSVYGGTFKMYGGAISYNTGVSVYAEQGDFMMCGGVITGTSSGYYGSAIRIDSGTLYIYETGDGLTLISENESYQGAIYVTEDSKTYIYGGHIEFNTASRDGGALYVVNSEAEISGGYIANNTAGYSGGAVYVNSSDLTMSGGVIYGNTAKAGGYEYGAAVFVRFGTFTMTDGEISGNVSSSSDSYGGGVNVSISAFTMSGGKIYDNTSAYAAGVYVYSSGSNAESTFTMTGGYIYGNNAGNGAGVYVDNYAVFEMSGGEIYENEATYNGFAGVYVTNSSSFTMKGGEIYDNHGTWGGGVGVYYSAKFIMEDGSIHGNNGDQYGGGVTLSGTTFSMTGGGIYGNTSEDDAGVCAMDSAVFTMAGGEIYGNTATKNYGGGVTVGNGATFEMYDGEIHDNSAATYGGGVAVLGSNTFNMYGGEIYSNTATTYGGGISTNSGSQLMVAGGSIYENLAQNGAGIYIAGTATLSTDLDNAENEINIYENTASVRGGGVYASTTFTMSGVVVIEGNTSPSGKDNLYLSSSSVYITLDGDIKTGSNIGLSLYSSTKTQITTAETSSEHYMSSAKYFHLDDDNLAYTYYVGYKNGNYVEVLSLEAGAAMVEHADGSMEVSSSAEKALQNAVNGDTIILYDDVSWSDCDFGKYVWYEVDAGFELTIDLNGHNIELDSDAYRAFRVYGTLNLTDSSAVYAEYSGTLEPGVYQNTDGTFTTIYKMTDKGTLETSTYSYTSGAIYGGDNTSSGTQYYGTIYVGEGGTLNIYGGTITGNKYQYGGGVYVHGDGGSGTAYFDMYGGSVSGNTVTRHGSGLYFGYNTEAYVYGGIITSNSANTTYYGGAIYAYDGADVYISEDTNFPTVLSHNTAYYGAALALDTNTVCVIDGGHFEFNAVTRDGGVVYTWAGAEVTINGGLFAYNTAAYSGGALYIRDALVMNGGLIYGNTSTTSKYGGGAICVYDSTGYFRMYGGEISGNEATSHYGGGIYTGNGAVFEMHGGEIKDNTASSDGGGIYLDDIGSTVYLYGGTLSGNKAAYGGGVYVTAGALYVEGGYIDGNSATYGGGVYSCDEVYIYDGGIINNTATTSGGGLYMDKNTFLVIEDGYIYGNEAKSYGGGVDSKAHVTMNGGYVSKNTAGIDGGGIYVSSNGNDTSMTMTGGQVTYNVSNGTSWGGGGILVNYETLFVMTDGEIAHNTAAAYGAGVYLGHGSTLTMTGGEIRENVAEKGAAGIYTQVCTCHDICEIEIGGKAVVRDNVLSSGEKSNVVLIEGQYITLLSDLDRTSYISVTLESGSQITTSESDTEYYLSSFRYFHADDEKHMALYSTNGKYVTLASVSSNYQGRVDYANNRSAYGSFVAVMDSAAGDSPSTAGTAVLLQDIYLDDISSIDGSTGYVVKSGKYINLDLNGHSIILSGSQDRAFTVNGYLSIDDYTGYYTLYTGDKPAGVYDNEDGTFTTIYKMSDPDTGETSLYSYTSGAITGGVGTGSTSDDGAIYVGTGGNLEIYGGTIAGNTYKYGAGIYIYGTSSGDTTFTMYGGSVSGNTATSQGGGIVASYCTVNIYGGIISGNTASSLCGGLAVIGNKALFIGTPSDAATAALCDVAPVISGNAAGTYGGGLYVQGTAVMTVSGANIEYNTSGSAGAGIYFSNSGATTFADAFIGYNSSATVGGGIYVASGDMTFSSGRIYFNEAGSAGYGGAGVYISSGATFSLTGGIVSQNVTAGYGGGYYLESGANLLVSNAEISFNTAASMGGGVYALGTLSVSGEAVIMDNTAAGLEENVLLSANNYIVLAGTLSGDAYIGVSFASASQTQITSQEETTTRYRTAYKYFFLDIDADKYFVYFSASRYVVMIPSDEVNVIVTDSEGVETYYATIEEAWAAALSTDPDAVNTVKLDGDVSPAETLAVSSGEYIALDFNGHTMYAPSPSPAIKIQGTLYMYDSTEVYAFEIEHEGEDAEVVDNRDGTYTTYYATVKDMDTGEKRWNSYTSGGITGLNTTDSGTGAVYVTGHGVLEMYGGSVVLNTAKTRPALYLNAGTGSDNPELRMYGGSVSGNKASGGSVGVYLYIANAYIYSGIFAASDAGSSGSAVLDCTEYSRLQLGTNDESILSFLEENIPDSYRAGVVVSGNYTGPEAASRIIYTSSYSRSFNMYDRAEISYNYQDADDRGMIQFFCTNAHFNGGTVAWNITGSTYGAIQYPDHADYAGNFYLGHNTTRTGGYGNIITTSALSFNQNFTGTVYISTELSEGAALKVTSGSATEDIYGHILSDYGYCRDIDTYLYFYHEHIDENTYLVYDGENFIVYDVCLWCDALINSYTVSKDDVAFFVDCDGNVVASYTETGDSGKTITGIMDGGYLVTSMDEPENETKTWYEDVREAIENLSEGDTLTLYEDTNLSGSGISIEAAGVTVDLNGHTLVGGVTLSGDGSELDMNGGNVLGDVTVSGDVNLGGGNISGDLTVSGSESNVDLGGGTVEGGLNVEDSSSVTVTDTSDGGSGYVGGEINVSDNDSSLTITGGSYGDTENVSEYLQPGCGEVIYVADGSSSYGIVSKDDINKEDGTGKTAEASVVATDGKTYYFESFADAVEFLNENYGGTITIIADVDCDETIEISSAITINLNGHTLNADFYIYAGKGYDDNPVSLAICDNSTNGVLVSTITVVGESDDYDDSNGNGSYEKTLTISSGVMNAEDSSVSVDLTKLTGNNVMYELTCDSSEGEYFIKKGHKHSYSNDTTKEFSYNPVDGTVTYIVKCACGETEKNTDGENVIYEGYIVGYTYSSMMGVTLYVTSDENATTTYEAVIMLDPVAMVQYEDGNGNIVTVFFETFEEAVAFAESILSGDATGTATLVLMGNATYADIDVSSGNLTINLNGYNLTGSVTVSENATVTVTSETAYAYNYNGGSTPTATQIQSGKNGNIDVSVTESDGGAFSITAGYISEDNLEYLEDYIAAGYVAIYESGRYAVISEDEAGENAVAYTVDAKGNKTYYLTLQDAIDAAENGDTVYITEKAETSGEESVEVFGKEITIDLNGYTLNTGIVVDNESSLTLRDTGSSEGLLNGSLSGNGAITVESGSYTTDVSAYLTTNKSLYVTYVLDPDTEVGTFTYTVIDKYGDSLADSAAASVTRTSGDGYTYTIYYDSIEGAMAGIKDGDTLTLLCDVGSKCTSQSLTFGSETGTINVTLDLNGKTVYGDLTVGGNANLTIVDSSAGIFGGVGSPYDAGSGSVTGTVAVDSSALLTVEGGTYNQDVSLYVDGDGEYAEFVSAAGEYTVMSEKEAQKNAKASVTYTDGDGYEHTIYFEDAYSALLWADSLSSAAESGAANVTVTLYDDVEMPSDPVCTTLEINGDITIDLNGNDINGCITVGENSSLTITGDGKIKGTVTVSGGNGTFVADGGTYSFDVGGYVSEGKVALVDSDGYYEVLTETEVQKRAAASVTVETVCGGNVVSSTTTYYENISDALTAVESSGESSDGTCYTLTLWDDMDEGDLSGDDKSLTLNGDFTFDMNGYDVNVSIVVSCGSDIGIDLAGGTVKGDITVGDENCCGGAGSASLTITDSSASEENCTAGTGTVNGTIIKNNDSSVTFESGTYTGSTDISGMIAEGSLAVNGSDGSTVVSSEETAKSISGAYVENCDNGNLVTTYYESAEDAIKAAAQYGGKVVLLGDASVTGLTIYGDVEIDLNGHSLYIEATIMADETYCGGESTGAGEGGSLKISDSTAKYENGVMTEKGTGSISGSVTVEGSKSASEETNAYENTLIFDVSAKLGSALNITLNLGSDGEGVTSGYVYVFEELFDSTGAYTGGYGIQIEGEHKHSYTIPVWSVDDYGNAVLVLKCSCGAEYEESYKINAEDLVMYDNGNGTYTVTGTVTATVTDEKGETYTTDYTYTDIRTIVATVTDGDGTYYFDSLQDAVDFVTGSEKEDLVIVLQTDANEDITVESGSATIDLNGKTLDGKATVKENASLTIKDSGAEETGSVGGNMEVSGELNLDGGTYGGGITVNGGGSLNVSGDTEINIEISLGEDATFTADGGTFVYTDEILGNITDALKDTEGSAYAYVTGDGTIIVTDDVAATEDARVKIVRDGVEIYYDSLEDACSHLAGGDTLVLLDGVAKGESVDISGVTGVTIDLNDNEILGSVTVSGGADVTITGDGYVDSVTLDDDSESSLSLHGGTYNDWSIVSNYTDYVGGYVIYVNDGYTYTVTTPDEAEKSAEAKTSSDGYGDIYFDKLQDAVDYALSDSSEETPEVTLVSDTVGGTNVTGNIVIDLNGNTLGGDIVVSSGTDFTLTDSSEDGSGSVSGQIYAGSGESGDGETTVNVEGGTVRDGVYGGDYTEVTVSGGTVNGNVETGDNSSVEVTENGVINGNVKTGNESYVTVGGEDSSGTVVGDISTGDGSSVTVENGEVGGSISTGKNSEATVTDSDVDGNISSGKESSIEVEKSRVGGDISTGADSEVTVSESIVEGGISTGYGAGEGDADSSSVTVENGSYVGGGISTGDGSSQCEENNPSVTVSESTVDGGIDFGEGTTFDFDGAAFGDDSVLDILGDGYVSVVTDDGRYAVVPTEDVESFADAYVETIDENENISKTYYENIEDAIAAAENSGGRVVLNRDVTCDETIDIYGKVEIDTNGYTLDADIVIHADQDHDGDGEISGNEYGAGGSLKVSDSSACDGNGGTGSITGSIAVEGGGDVTGSGNPYEDTLIFTDGMTPGADLSVDLSELGSDGTGYVLGTDSEGDIVISSKEGHTHSYDIEVWELDENGNMTLKFMCACGDYDPNGPYDAKLEITENSDKIVYTYTVYVGDENDPRYGNTYEKVVYYDIVASVTDGEGKHNFASVQDAVDYVLENGGGTVTLESDFEGDIVIDAGGNIEIDLAGQTYEGSITVSDGATLTFKDTSDEGKGELIISGGDVDGALVIVSVDVTLTGDLDVSDGDLVIEGKVDIDLGDSTLTAAPEISSESSLTVTGGEGSEFDLSDDLTLDGDASLTIGGETDFDLGGYTLTVAEDTQTGTSAGTFTLDGSASVTFDGGKIYGDITVDDEADVTIDVGSGTLEGEVTGDGSVTEYVSEGGSVTGNTEVSGDVSVYVDGGTYEGNVTSDTGNVLVNVTGGGSFTGDIAAESEDGSGGVEILVDGVGSVIDGDITSSGNAEITVTEGGKITTTEDGGTGITVGGDAEIKMNGGAIESDITFEGDADVYVGSGSVISGDMTFEGSSILDLAGGTVSGEDATITVGESGSLSVIDSSSKNTGTIDTDIVVEEGGSLEMHDDTYKYTYDEDNSVVVGTPYVSFEGGDDTDYVFVAAAEEEDGTVYYETMTKDNHDDAGHGYDIATYSYKLDPEHATLTITFTCLCGDNVECVIDLEYGVNYTTTYELCESADYAIVTVSYDIAEYVEAPNGVVYPVQAKGSETLYGDSDKLYTVDASTDVNGENFNYGTTYSDTAFTFGREQTANCYQGGVDIYTYGDGGIIVVVTSGAVHTGYNEDDEHHWTVDDLEIFYCDECETYYINDITASAGNGYTKEGLEAEIGNYNDFTSSIEDAGSSLEKLYEDLGISDENKYGAYDALKDALDALENLTYDFLGDDSGVYDGLNDAIREILDEAELAITNAAYAESAESEIKSAYDGIIDSLKESGDWTEEKEQAIADELEAILSDLAHVKAPSTSESDLTVFETFLQTATGDLESVMKDVISANTTTNVSSSEESGKGFSAGIEVTEGDGFSGTIELVIEDAEDESFYAWVIANSDLTYYVGGQETEYIGGDLEDLVYGKGVVAVFDIYLRDSSSGVKVYVFSGTYLVSVTLPDKFKEIEGLQVVYVGDDGRVEVYETFVENGVLYFTTTHFSEFVLLGDADTEYVVGGTGTSAEAAAGEAEKETDLMAAIIALAVVDGVLLILGIVLLIVLLMRKGKIGGKKSATAVGLFALLSIVPAGGLAITIVLGVLALAFLSADIYLIYAVFTAVPVVEYVENGEGEGQTSVDTNGDVTVSSSEDDGGEDREDK